MALDLIHTGLYLSDAAAGNSVWCTNLDGTHPEPVVSGLLAPQDVAGDTPGNEIYWADGDAGKARAPTSTAARFRT